MKCFLKIKKLNVQYDIFSLIVKKYSNAEWRYQNKVLGKIKVGKRFLLFSALHSNTRKN